MVQLDTNNQVTFTANRVAFLADFPDSDPAGGAMELELAFIVVRPTDGSPAFVATVKNQTPTY